MQLKIISLNLAGFKDWELRRQKIIDFIDKENPDVLLLQEVKFDPLISSFSQSTLLNQLLQKPFAFTQTAVSKFYQPSVGESYREGLAILSKFPIKDSEALVFDKHPRIIQSADLLINEQTVGIANIHLSNNKYSVEQLRELITIFASRKEERIIAGDFNILQLENEKESYIENYTSSTDFKKYVSFPSENITLDYVLVPKHFAFESLDIYEGLSDHNALVFVVGLSEKL
ncbi:MAG TPA: endonuclease/exonuclease/phosphatase family protein [Candidatus Chromulinivoraceae bacterium]|nr:endonuclease/exonuclease/phosphatase family protein [Candidatus Chromulinivoraceae bacterium]